MGRDPREQARRCRLEQPHELEAEVVTAVGDVLFDKAGAAGLAVADYQDAKFEAFRNLDGVEDAEASSMSLEEIFVALVGEPAQPEGAVR